jgi:rhodanese-related sulfurtransferase
MATMEIEPKQLFALIQKGAQQVVLDVRSAREFASGHVPSARHFPFWSAPFRRVPAKPDDRLVVYCGHGPRAEMAVRALRARGFRNLLLLRGHMSAWRRAGLPVER